jgi:hypothetical protein
MLTGQKEVMVLMKQGSVQVNKRFPPLARKTRLGGLTV